jgi:hypothetical protein
MLTSSLSAVFSKASSTGSNFSRVLDTVKNALLVLVTAS